VTGRDLSVVPCTITSSESDGYGPARIAMGLEQQADHLADDLVLPGWQPKRARLPFLFGICTRRTGRSQ
jgi:hypothetical protein